jgi:tetratricopeptide (TPR) repeat protein
VIAHRPENILGARVYWKERNYNTQHVLERDPSYIYFSTGSKPSAAAERALFLRRRFRQGYYPCPVSVVERGQVYSDALYRRKPGADTLPIESPGVNQEFVYLYNLGINLARPQKYDSAIATFRRCNEIAPDDFGYAHEWLGQLYLSMGQDARAVEHLRRAIEIDDWCINAHQTLGNVYFNRQQYDSAATEFRKVVAYAPDYFEGYVNLSAALAQAQNYVAAETVIEASVRRFPSVPDLALRLAYVRYIGGKIDAAEQDLLAILARSPGQQEARQLLDRIRSQRAAGLPPQP